MDIDYDLEPAMDLSDYITNMPEPVPGIEAAAHAVTRTMAVEDEDDSSNAVNTYEQQLAAVKQAESIEEVEQGTVEVVNSKIREAAAEVDIEQLNQSLIGEAARAEQYNPELGDLIRSAVIDHNDPDAQAKAAIYATRKDPIDSYDAHHQYYVHSVAKLAKEFGILDYAGLIAEGFVPFLSGSDLRDITGGNILTSYSARKDFVVGLRNMSAGAKSATLDSLLTRAKEDGEVTLKEMQSIISLFGSEAIGEAEFDAAISALDFVGAGQLIGSAVTLGAVVKSATTAAKHVQPLQRTTNLNNQAAADMVAASIENPKVQKELNITTNEQVEATLPLNMTPVSPDTPSASLLSGLIHDNLNVKTRQALERADHDLKEILQDKNRYGALSDIDKQILQQEGKQAFLDRINKNEAVMDDADVVPISPTEFVIKGVDTDGVQHSEVATYKMSDLDDTFDVSGNPLLKETHRLLNSPLVTMKGAMGNSGKWLVQRGQFLENRKEELTLVLNGVGKALATNIDPKELAKLDQLLLHGDELPNNAGGIGVVFTPDQLLKGVPYNNGYIKLSKEGVARYQVMRNLADILWDVENTVIRDKKVNAGYKGIHLDSVSDLSKAPVRPDSAQDHGIPLTEADAVATVATKKKAWVNGEVKTVLAADIETAYKQGMVLITRMDKGFKTETLSGKPHFVKQALVPRSAITDLPREVVHKKPGWIPKENKHANYWVVQSIDEVHDGVPVTREVALANYRTVDQYEATVKKLLEDHPEIDPNNIRAVPNGALTENVRNNIAEVEAGGVSIGHRSSRELYHADTGRGYRASAFESFDKLLQGTADRFSMSLYRDQLKQRVLSAAQKANNGKGLLADPTDIDSKPVVADADKSYKSLLAAKHFVSNMTRIPTAGERAVMNATKLIGQEMGRIPKVGGIITDISHKNPVAGLRAMAFHPLMGMYSIGQLWVQGMNFTVAASLDPINVFKNFRRFMGLRLALYKRGSAPTGTHKTLAKSAGMSLDEFNDTVDEMRYLGLHSSVRNNADYNSVATGGAFQLASRAKDLVFRKGAVFLTEAEAFSRMYSYLVAKQRYLKANPNVKGKLTDAQLQRINVDVNNMTQNMQMANRANLQRGIPSMFTQFKGVHLKFMETMLPSLMKRPGAAFTQAEAARIYTGQTIMFGTVFGMPAGKFFYDTITEVTGTRPYGEDGSPRDKTMFEDFIHSGLAGVTIGLEGDFSRRVALGSGVTSLISDFTEDPIKTLTPPVSTTLDRLGNIVSSFKTTFDKIGSEEYPLEVRDVLLPMEKMAKLSSGGSHVMSGMSWIINNRVMDSKGRLLAEDPTLWEGVMKIAGITPLRFRESYEITKLNQDIKQSKRDAVARMTEVAADYIGNGLLSGEDGYKNLIVLMRLSIGGDKRFSVSDLDDMVTRSMTAAVKGSDRVNRAYEQAMKEAHTNPNRYQEIINQLVRHQGGIQ